MTGVEEPPTGARTVTVAAQRLARWLDGFAERHGDVRTSPSSEVVALIGADGARAWLDVPFPPLTSDLVAHVARDRRVGVLLVRRGGYAAGVFVGRELVASKVGSRYVQGGTNAADATARVLGDAELDAFVAGGDRDAVRAVLSDPRLAHLHPSGPWLQVQDVRLRSLQAAPEQFRAVRIRLDP